MIEKIIHNLIVLGLIWTHYAEAVKGDNSLVTIYGPDGFSEVYNIDELLSGLEKCKSSSEARKLIHNGRVAL